MELIAFICAVSRDIELSIARSVNYRDKEGDLATKRLLILLLLLLLLLLLIFRKSRFCYFYDNGYSYVEDREDAATRVVYEIIGWLRFDFYVLPVEVESVP